MESTDLTLQVLIEIREQIRATNTKVDTGFAAMNDRLEGVGRRIDQTNRQLLVTEARLATEISALRGTQHDSLIELRERVVRCERDIEELRQRRD
ncbi:MAG TPA: hypothetical protein VIU61_30810 [Kofleriaceae bacterium]